jgi:phosphate:Na+ symporter
MFQLIFSFLGGICLLIYGVDKLSKSLEKLSTSFINKASSKFTQNVYTSFAAGTIITALTQSSTAVTLITVSLVNANIIDLSKAVGIIYGANLGTTVTAQLMSISLVQYDLLVFASGFILSTFKNKNLKLIGGSIMGLGFMFLGLKTLQSGVPYIKNNSIFFDFFKNSSSNPLYAIIIGALTTMLIQSSSATVGFTIVLFNEGLISFYSAIALTLGDNIGTCITAQIASINLNVKARRTAWAHTLYNVFGVILVLILIPV